MRKKLVTRFATFGLGALLGACGSSDDDARGTNANGDPSATTVQTVDLTGLYQASSGGRKTQMCMVAGAAGKAAFAIATENEAGGSCAGAGEAVRRGATVQLTMAGDQHCVVDARIEGTRVTFPDSVVGGCAYYCSPGASFARIAVDKVGGTRAEAMKATDLAGDPLCG